MLLAAQLAMAASPEESYRSDIKPILEDHCFSCHGEGVSKGEFSMDTFTDLSGHVSDLKHWMPIWENVRSQVMPPSDEDQLSSADKKTLQSWIEREVFKLDPENPDPGRVTIRRLNRTEYQNAVFDLLGVEYNTMDVFPPDDTGYGFDNIGDVLSISPLLMEKFISAADEVVNLALPKDDGARLPRIEIAGEKFVSQSNPETTGRWLPFSKPAQVGLDYKIPWKGTYQVSLGYSIRGATEATVHEARMKFSAGGKVIGEIPLDWDQRRVIEVSKNVTLKMGAQNFEVAVSPARPPAEGEEELALTLQKLTIVGPLDGTRHQDSKAYRMIFIDGPPPDDQAGRERYAKKIMRSFVSRAFRRPLENATVNRLAAIVREIDVQPGKKFEDGIKEAIATCLCSPRFLFRVEIQPEPDNPNKIVLLDEFALAARLSFFLWGSVPDDKLLSLAHNKKLRADLPAQIQRMLDDPRSGRMVRNFVGQWLRTRDVDTVPMDARKILGLENRREASRIFDVRLRKDMRKETEMLFDFILRNDRPAEEMISARYSFLNGRLADFYGIHGVKGEKFVPVDLTDHPERGGILTHGSYLIVSSNPTRTSPVKRGLFVLENLLGTPAPPAPPNVPALEDSADAHGGNPTMREMMEIHRKNPECRGCHARMDPIGLGLENFNALGQFRKKDHGKDIDASGELLTGESFANIAELKEILADKRKQDFYRCLSEKLLTFAIGRGVEYHDATTIDQLVERLERNNGKLQELIIGIIESAPFQKRRGTD